MRVLLFPIVLVKGIFWLAFQIIKLVVLYWIGCILLLTILTIISSPFWISDLLKDEEFKEEFRTLLSKVFSGEANATEAIGVALSIIVIVVPILLGAGIVIALTTWTASKLLGTNSGVPRAHPGIGTYPYMAGGERSPKPSSGGYGSGGGDYQGSSSSRSRRTESQPESNPLFRASRVESTLPPSNKLLKDSSGSHIGTLREDPLFGRTQLIDDPSGRTVGKIKPDPFFEGKQIVEDASGRQIGSIEDNWKGDRVVKDKDGREIGKFEEGRIKRSGS